MSLFFLFLGGVIAAIYLAKNKNGVIKKARKMQTLFRLVRTQNKNILKILWVMIILIIKTLYVWMCQTLNGSFRQVDKNTFEITYVVGGVMYKMIAKAKRGPRKIICCMDEKSRDMTELLNAYYGPNEDFHGHAFTPDFFERESLTFNLSNGEEMTFHRNQKISI